MKNSLIRMFITGVVAVVLSTLEGPASAVENCAALGAMPIPPARTRSVTEFGAIPDDDEDDTAAIQRAFDSLQPGEWLRFPPGRYIQRKSVWLRTRGVVLWGEGATIHATNPDDQSVILAADGASIYGFRLTAKTDRRRTAPWHARISIFDRVERKEPLKNNVVRRNVVENAGPPGSPEANGASAGGIFVFRAQGFLLAENRIVRTLADGIHVTAGSRDGRVLNNVVRETGDDMIGLVSYLGDGSWTERTVDDEVRNLDRRDALMVRNVVVEGNDLSGQYWGRGISVVGGEEITIARNKIEKATHGAAVYIAREPSYLTFGVKNVRVEHNTIRDVQTTAPAYLPPDQPVVRTGHAAIEIYSRMFVDEGRIPKLTQALRIERIYVGDNSISSVIADGIRVGLAPEFGLPMVGKRRDGVPLVRAMMRGDVSSIDVKQNRIAKVASDGLAIRFIGKGNASSDVVCGGNTLDGQAIGHAACRTTAETSAKASGATGAPQCAQR